MPTRYSMATAEGGIAAPSPTPGERGIKADGNKYCPNLTKGLLRRCPPPAPEQDGERGPPALAQQRLLVAGVAAAVATEPVAVLPGGARGARAWREPCRLLASAVNLAPPSQAGTRWGV